MFRDAEIEITRLRSKMRATRIDSMRYGASSQKGRQEEVSQGICRFQGPVPYDQRSHAGGTYSARHRI